jgi:hypothetical protein
VRAQQRLRQAVAGHGVGREYGVGARAAHFRFGAFFRRTSGHIDVRIEALGGEEYKQVVGVGGQRGHQAAGVLNSHFAQSLIARGIRHHRQ